MNEIAGTKIDRMLSRGIGAPAGLDKEIAKKLADAISKAAQDPEHIKRIDDLGMEVNTITGEEYLESLKQQEKSISDMKSVFGW
ncbi:hypothetical protein AM499_09985 [Bacillus sp. FJAT-22090]|nr:hypothetical protein AM499_09985 [Bacillus sp. FJAT-22090]